MMKFLVLLIILAAGFAGYTVVRRRNRLTRRAERAALRDARERTWADAMSRQDSETERAD